MRKLFTILVAVLLTASVFAQSPEKMSYQAVVRNSSDQLVTDQAIGMQISILQGSATGTAIYVEIQAPTTNANGLVTLEIGNGEVVSGDFTTIDWANGPYFIKTETDPTTAGGTNYTITGTSQLLSVPYALHAKTAENGVTTYSVGDFAQGGVVFWVDETGQHGLVCAKTDHSTSTHWYAGAFGNTQAKGDGPFSGESNTSIIISAQVAIGDDDATYAARICNELQITENGKTYGDWYLPSKEELNLIYQNKATIDATATANGGAAFAANIYWTSTEHDSGYAKVQYFNTGNQSHDRKNSINYVRAIRAF
ncbi:MAG: DUF1566 domain-containing protein [Bacteroidales bacterium]|nr:DUF1566 domain-containing protein [Bacteroidales bacterium]